MEAKFRAERKQVEYNENMAARGSAAAGARGLSTKAPVTASGQSSSGSGAYRTIDQASNVITPAQQAIIDQVNAFYTNDENNIKQLAALTDQNYKIGYDKLLSGNQTQTATDLSKNWMSLFSMDQKTGSDEEYGYGNDGEMVNLANASIRANDKASAQAKADYDNSIATNALNTQQKIATDEGARLKGVADSRTAMLEQSGAQTSLANSLGLTDTTQQSTTTAAARAMGTTPNSAPVTPGYRTITATTPGGVQAQNFAAARLQDRMASQ